MTSFLQIKQFLFAAVIVLLGLTACSGGERPDKSFVSKGVNSGEKEHLVGAYTEYRPVEKEDLAVFNEARDNYIASGSYTEEQATRLKSFIPAEVKTQVVAGLNYMFRNASEADVIITVFCPLPGQGEPQIVELDAIL